MRDALLHCMRCIPWPAFPPPVRALPGNPVSSPFALLVAPPAHPCLLLPMASPLQVVEVAAVAGLGLDELEEALLLQAELMELQARGGSRRGAVHAVHAPRACLLWRYN